MHMLIYHALSQIFPVRTKVHVSGRLDLGTSMCIVLVESLYHSNNTSSLISPFLLIYPFIKHSRLSVEGVELRRLSWLYPNPGEKTQKLARYFHIKRY